MSSGSTQRTLAVIGALLAGGCASTVDGPPTPPVPQPVPAVTSAVAEPVEFGPESVRVTSVREVAGGGVVLTVVGPDAARYAYRDSTGRTGECTQADRTRAVEVTCLGVRETGDLLVSVDRAPFSYAFEVPVG
ncbi:MAG TPA: hypothetical protein VGP16_33135 [Asanoa sp.]|jgi:hypothetical protein|nr:hypothetical protein [Asanoa sp.]